jgi:hypothetical protein
VAIKRLRELQQQNLTRDELLLKLGAARKKAGKAYATSRTGRRLYAHCNENGGYRL